MAIRFEREPLYREVWSTPLTSLAKKYGMSDNGIRKVCKALQIPLPRAGHWARVAAGHSIPAPALPVTHGPTEFYSRPTLRPPPSAELTADEQWLKERSLFERDPANRITVELPPQRWHKLAIPLRDELREKAKEMNALRSRVQKRATPARQTDPSFHSDQWHWRRFVAEGQLLAGPPLRVSSDTCERALAIFNSLLFAAEQRGFTVARDRQSNRLSLKLYGCDGHVRLTERLVDVPSDSRNETPLERALSKGITKRSSGTLRIYFSASGYSESAFSETADRPLEAHLNDFFARFYKAVVRKRVAQRERAERERAYREEEQRRRQAEAVKQQEATQLAKERERRKALLAEASAWREAMVIRDYMSHIERTLAQSGGAMQSELKAWLMWMERVADDMDPTQSRINASDNASYR